MAVSVLEKTVCSLLVTAYNKNTWCHDPENYELNFTTIQTQDLNTLIFMNINLISVIFHRPSFHIGRTRILYYADLQGGMTRTKP